MVRYLSRSRVPLNEKTRTCSNLWYMARARPPLPSVDTITGVTDNSENVVLVEQRDRVLVITINRPEAKNAVNAAVSRALADAMDRLDGDAGLSVGVITGAGGSFCA